MKKVNLLVLIISISLIFSGCTPASQNDGQSKASRPTDIGEGKAVLYFFWGQGCPHCEDQKPFLEEMKNKYPELVVKDYETWKNRDNAALLQDIAAAYGTRAQGVPTTFIGDGEPFVGFAEGMKADMENRIKTCVEQGCINPVSKL